MTKLFQVVVAACAIAIAASCGQTAGPSPAKLTPVQVPPAIQADGTAYLLINVGTTPILLAVNGASVTQLPVTVVNVNGPGPTPQPNPTPTPTPQPTPLTPRQALFRDAANQATVDPMRASNARVLAQGYLVASQSDSQEKMAKAAKDMADSVIPQGYAEAWKPFRDALSNEWNALVRLPSTTGDYASLLRDAAAGLNASANASRNTP